MKRKHLRGLLALCCLLPLGLAGCGGDSPAEVAPVSEEAAPVTETGGMEVSRLETAVAATLRLTVNGTEFTAVLHNSPAAKALLAKCPLTLEMEELNGNEKYFYFDEDFPTEDEAPAEIRAGDVMLYEGRCLVLFYKDHQNTGYRYTRLGAVTDPGKLAAAAGAGSCTVVWGAP